MIKMTAPIFLSLYPFLQSISCPFYILFLKILISCLEKKSLRGKKKNNRIQNLIVAEIILAALSYMQINPQLNGFNYSKKA